MMKLTHIRDLLAVAEAGSLRSAGRHLDIAQPVITRSIRELEQELGATLFERHAKGVKLTPMGEVFVRRARSIDAELRRAREEIAQLGGSEIGQVSIALSTATCMSLLPSAIAAFYRRYPDATVKISESLFQPIEQYIIGGEIDFWVGPLEPASASPQFVVEELFGNSRRIVARKGHPLSGARSLQELTDARWVRPTLSTRTTEADFESMFKMAGLPPPKIAIHSRSSLITVLTIASTDFLSVLPQQWVEFSPLAHLFQALELPDFMPGAPMCIVRRQGLPLTPLAEYLSDQLRKAGTNYALNQSEA
ncbi:MAG: LysR-family transcriptional regulator [Bradyrhizobium sp.]|nr:LysR-family transcriptional regulator [Bradyrhizobium sp.]